MELPVKIFKKDLLAVEIFQTRDAMGRGAAKEAANWLRRRLSEKESVRAVFAAAPSQNEFLAALVAEPGIDWTRIHALHMDEYVGLEEGAPQTFGSFLRNAIFDRVPFGSVEYIGSDGAPEALCARYTDILRRGKVDVVFMGIGENGHIAFNDPHVALFNDPVLIKKVDLDPKCRMQQVHDGCFPSIDAVPKYALTLTIPAMTAAERIFCVVPAPSKADAVLATLTGPVSESCPSSILRRHPAATLYLDADSAAKL